MINPGYQIFGLRDCQQPFNAAVIMTTIGRPSITRAVQSVFNQTNIERVQLLIGIDKPLESLGELGRLLSQTPKHVSVALFYPGYSTSQRHGGLHLAHDGGAMRTLLSYLANARHLTYLDDDNWYAPNHLSNMLNVINGKPWCFSYRWFVHPQTQACICVDTWDSIGPHRGIYAEKFDGWCDPNTIMIDKTQAEPVLRFWSVPIKDDVHFLTADRNVFHWLKSYAEPAVSQIASVFYTAQPHHVVQAEAIVQEHQSQSGGV